MEQGAASRIPRLLGEVGPCEGPTLICVGGIHGNEPAGVKALERLLSSLPATDLRGRLVALTGNRRALAQGRRFLHRDLNRRWSSEHLAALGDREEQLQAEDAEMLELHREVERALETARGPVFALDLHTTSGPGPAFGILDDTLRNRRFASLVPVPMVLGLEEELEGTFLSYLATRQVVTLACESGQHEDPASVDHAEAILWLALRSSGVLGEGEAERLQAARRSLRISCRGCPAIVEVQHRHPIEDGEVFRMRPGFVSFQRVTKGELLATFQGEPLVAPQSGLLLMPLYQDQGEDGFFLVRSVSRFWLWLSAGMRRIGSERLLHWLPGVSRHPDLPDGFLVDRQVARWLALELFHLLGFQRQGDKGRYLTLSRRANGP